MAQVIIQNPSNYPLQNVATIVKVKVGGKFYIAKTHNIKWFEHELRRELDKIMLDSFAKPNKLYQPIIEYAISKDYPIVIELIYSNVSGYKAMKYELELLAKHYGKKNCLNENNIPHIPKTPITSPLKPNGYTWLSVNDEINFRKLLKKYEY